jgi:hypothetical protein
LGSIGVAALLVAFGLNLWCVLQSESVAYHALNILGSSLACIASVMLGVAPFAVLEAVWFVMSTVRLFRSVMSTRRAPLHKLPAQR